MHDCAEDKGPQVLYRPATGSCQLCWPPTLMPASSGTLPCLLMLSCCLHHLSAAQWQLLKAHLAIWLAPGTSADIDLVLLAVAGLSHYDSTASSWTEQMQYLQ